MSKWELRQGTWQSRLRDVECDLLLCDPPYGARTHVGHDAGVDRVESDASNAWERSELAYRTARRGQLDYGSMTHSDVQEFVKSWAPRTRGWMAVMSCSDLFPAWRQAMADVGRVTFAPIPCVIRGMTVRLSGDGPSSWAVYLNVSRPRSKQWSNWGTRPGAYISGRGARDFVGGKPLDLIRTIVRDYSSPGDLVCDPCAGFGTTLLAAIMSDREAIGAEVDAETCMRAQARLNGARANIGEQKQLWGNPARS